MNGGDDLDLECLARTESPGFEKRIVELGPDELLPFDPAVWRDTIVFVLAGQLEVECTSGARACFRCGAILPVSPLPVRKLRNPAAAPVRLLAISRRAADAHDVETG